MEEEQKGKAVEGKEKRASGEEKEVKTLQRRKTDRNS